MLKGKKIIIGVTGSISAFKIPVLIRLLKKEEAIVKIVMTPAATAFVTPLTLSTLSENPVLVEPFNRDTGEWNSHVELGLWADLFIIAPASANTIAKMANGVADNFLLISYLSAKCPVFFAPAMDLSMYKHPTTQQNIKILQSYGNFLIHPAAGELASGLCGEGRLEEPENILGIIKSFLTTKDEFAGKKVLISAGPTFEAIDPVRFISNYSSGNMGYAIAWEFANRGAKVLLISGPSHLDIQHPNINKTGVVSAREMYDHCIAHFDETDITVMAAAIADYTPVNPEVRKIKKKNKDLKIELKPTVDILETLGKQKKSGQILVGFALETDNELENAKKKLKNKNLDLVVLNSLNDPGAGFQHETNKITIIDRDFNEYPYQLKNKSEVAKDIVDRIKELTDNKQYIKA